MAHLDEMLAIVAAIRGTHALRTGDPPGTAALEERLHVDLGGTHDAPGPERALARFAPHPESPLPLSGWIDHLKTHGAKRLILTRVDRRRPALAGTELPDERILRAFAGSFTLMLGVPFGKTLDLYSPATLFPRRTDLLLRDVVRFMTEYELDHKLIPRLLWEDEHNLHFTEGGDWDALAAAVTGTRIEAFIEAVSRAMSNVAFTEQERSAWFGLCHDRRNPAFGPVFLFRRSGTIPLPTLDTDVAAQTARLRKALLAIRGYAGGQKLSHWADIFDGCLGLLDAPSGDRTLVDEVLEGTAVRDDARRLIATAFQSDVFGGMGSWNDLPIDVDEDYRRVSNDLFEQIPPSLEIGTNAATA